MQTVGKPLSLSALKLRQIDESLQPLRASQLPARPRAGWIKAIRTALGMTSKALAERLGVSGPAVSQLEQSEAMGTITLNSLRRAAEALDCELHYVLVPRAPLKEIRRKRAHELAVEQLRPVLQTMNLEDQKVSAKETQRQIDELTDYILASAGKRLW